MGQKLNPNAPIYNMALLFELHGAVDVEVFRSAFARLVRESDAMRLVFPDSEDDPQQLILGDLPYDLEFLDWSDRAEPSDGLVAWAEARSRQLFNLEQRCFDAVLIRLTNNHYAWYFNEHHLIIDAWGMTLQYKAMASFYWAMLSETIPDITLPAFADQLASTPSAKTVESRAQACQYWESKLPKLPDPLSFYGKRVVYAGPQSKRMVLDLGTARSTTLRELATAADLRSWTAHLSLFTIFSTVLFAFLHRVSGRDRIAIGTPAHNRSTTVHRATPGLFIEVFPLLAEIQKEDTFGSLYERLRTEVNGFLRYAQPAASSPELSRGFNVILNYISASFGNFGDIPMHSTWIHPDCHDPSHHLRLQVHDFDAGGAIQLHFDLNTSVFDAELQEKVPTHFITLLDAFIADRSQLIGQPALTSDLPELAGPIDAVNYDEAIGVLGMLQQQVQWTPNGEALQYFDQKVSYRQLDEEANQLAHFLLDHGLKVGDRVGIHLKRSPEFMVAALAVMKAGGCFVPLPVNYPAGRILGIIEDAEARLVLTTASLAEKATIPDHLLIRMDTEQPFFSRQARTVLPVAVGSEDLAYLLYTSGSTGRPKGVMIHHKALSHYLQYARETYVQKQKVSMPLFTSTGFDLTITSMFLPLVSGGHMVIYPEPDQGPDLTLLDVINDNEVNLIKLTPSHLALLKGKELAESRIQTMIVGGEYFKAELARTIFKQFGDGLEIYNEYGPTEATVGCVVHRCKQQDLDDSDMAVPIGLPINRMQVYILDEFLHPVSSGLTGELFISGPGLAQGYWQQEALTNEKFLPNPFRPGERMYRTGDLVRHKDKSGMLEYLGRKDEQIKIGGRRVEPEEITTALLEYPGVQQGVVLLYQDKPASPQEAEHNCVRCGLPSNYPKAEFDEQGVCHLCRSFKGYQDKVSRYFRTIPDLKERFREVQHGDHPYDCIMLYSGGKDSTYALAQLVELGIKPLSFTLDNGYISEEAKANIRRVVKALGVDHVFGETPAMNAIFVDSLQRHQNVCDGCFKTIYTLSIQLALEKNIPYIVTGLSRGQFFETRLTEELFVKEDFNPDEIDQIILEARKAYHRVDDAVKQHMDVSMFERDDVFDKVRFLDFYRYTDVSLAEMYDYLDRRLPWVRPSDTGRSTNCLINKAGIYVHKKELGYSNYAFPYSWDVRVGHKTRAASLDEINEEIPEDEVLQILDEIGYSGQLTTTETDRLVAYYTSEAIIETAVLRNSLLSRFPDYMVPVHYIRLESIPLTVNGKIDRDALPPPGPERPVLEVEYTAPRSDIEELLAELWSDILQIDRIGVFDNFVQIGGDSLKGIRLMARINETLELDLPINTIFEKTTIADLADHIEATINRLLAEMDG